VTSAELFQPIVEVQISDEEQLFKGGEMTFRRIISIVFLPYLAACGGPDSRAPVDLVNDLMIIWESGESDRLAELMSTDVVYDDIPNGVSLQGIDASRGYVAHVHKWASSVEISVHRAFGTETDAVAEWTMTAIQSAPIPGRIPVATNNKITLQGATLIHVEGGKITRAADYLDALGFVLQLGSEVTLPGDVVLKLPQ
jgi:steroid delta-isomerase-like uncharacterized protein